MKILLIADNAEPTLWEHLDKRKLEGVELVLSCGDLPASYLSFLTCFTPAPILYIHGNHDDRYASAPPEGCICIEDTIYTYKGIRILGLGGSMRYNKGINQYTEKQMRARVGRLRFKLWRSGGIDILLTHLPWGDAFSRAESGRRQGFGAYGLCHFPRRNGQVSPAIHVSRTCSPELSL